MDDGRPALPVEHLRAEVRRMKTTAGRQRLVPVRLHVGDLGGARLVMPVEALGDAGDVVLAGDVVTRALDRLGGHEDQQVWLTRGGDLDARDADWRWRAGAAAARGRLGLPAGRVFVVTRHGWLALPGLERRTWKRMRASWRPPYDDDRPELDEPDPVEGWPVRF